MVARWARTEDLFYVKNMGYQELYSTEHVVWIGVCIYLGNQTFKLLDDVPK